MWVVGVADSQTRSKPLKTSPNHPKIAFFDPNFTFCFPKSHKNPGMVGWVNRFVRDLPKKKFYLVAFPNFGVSFCSFDLAASMVTASFKQLTSLVCSSELSSLSKQALSSSGRSRAASPRSCKSFLLNITLHIQKYHGKGQTWAKCKLSAAA